MPRTDQTFSLWMEGDLVATGRNGCDMEFVSNVLNTPECSSDMWVAIEAVDAEATSFGGHSKGGIKAAFEWCGQEIHTDDTWECSTVGERGWQNPRADGWDPRQQVSNRPSPFPALLVPAPARLRHEPAGVKGVFDPVLIGSVCVCAEPDVPAQAPDLLLEGQDARRHAGLPVLQPAHPGTVAGAAARRLRDELPEPAHAERLHGAADGPLPRQTRQRRLPLGARCEPKTAEDTPTAEDLNLS